MQHVHSGEPYRITGRIKSKVVSRDLYFREYIASGFLSPFILPDQRLDYQCAKRFINDIVSVFGTLACVAVMKSICPPVDCSEAITNGTLKEKICKIESADDTHRNGNWGPIV